MPEGFRDALHHLFSLFELLQQSEANGENLRWIGFDVESLLVDSGYEFHQKNFLFYHQWVVNNSDNWTDNLQYLLIDDFSLCILHQELHHIQSLFHSFTVSISDTLNQDVNVVDCSLSFFPDNADSSFKGIVFNWDNHLFDVKFCLFLFGIGDENFKDFMNTFVDL